MRQLPSFRPSWPARLGLGLALLLSLAAGTVLALVFLTLFIGGAVFLGGWLWWQGRRLRRQAENEFINAEYTVEMEYPLLEDRRRSPARSERQS